MARKKESGTLSFNHFQLTEVPPGKSIEDVFSLSKPKKESNFFLLTRILAGTDLLETDLDYIHLTNDAITALQALNEFTPLNIVLDALKKTCRSLSISSAQSTSYLLKTALLKKVEEALLMPSVQAATKLIMTGVISYYKTKLTSPQLFAIEEIQRLEFSPESTLVIIKKIDECLSKEFFLSLENLDELTCELAAIEWVAKHYDELLKMNPELKPEDVCSWITYGFWYLVQVDKSKNGTSYSFAESVDLTIQIELNNQKIIDLLKTHPSKQLRKYIDRYDLGETYSPKGIFRKSKVRRENEKTVLKTLKDCLELLLIPELDELTREKIRSALLEALGRKEFQRLLSHTFGSKTKGLTASELKNTSSFLFHVEEFQGMNDTQILTYFIKILNSEDAYNELSSDLSEQTVDFASFMMEILEDKNVLRVIYRNILN